MATFTFVQDVEVIGIRRSYFNVEADSLDEARKKMQKYSDDDILTYGNLSHEGIERVPEMESVTEDDRKDYEGFTGDRPEVKLYDQNGTEL